MRADSTLWIDKMSARRNNSSLLTRSAPCWRARSSVRFSLQAIGFMPMPAPILRDPGAEIAEPEQCPASCRRDRSRASSAKRHLGAWCGTPVADVVRTLASGRWPARPWKGRRRRCRIPATPCSLAAARSIEALRLPVVTSSLRLGSFSNRARGKRRALAHDADHIEARRARAPRRRHRQCAR